jgi:hypothetical protein|tara:strand:- start:5897 stop:6508 length:612 start_codon:yes stop_codon:yes gene_type:complete
MTIVKVIDKRLSHFEIKLPKQNIIVKLNDQYDSSFKSVIPKKKVVISKPKKETYTDIEPTVDNPEITQETSNNEGDIENFFEGINYQNKSMNRTPDIIENFSNDIVQENFYDDSTYTNGLEKFGNINHNPDDNTSRISVYTNWLKTNKKNYHSLPKIHIKNLMKVLKGKELADKDVPESFVIVREGEENIEKAIPQSSCGCGN